MDNIGATLHLAGCGFISLEVKADYKRREGYSLCQLLCLLYSVRNSSASGPTFTNFHGAKQSWNLKRIRIFKYILKLIGCMNGWLELSVILVLAGCIGLYRMIKYSLVVAESLSMEKLLICAGWQLAKFWEHLFGQVCKSLEYWKSQALFFTWSSSL